MRPPSEKRLAVAGLVSIQPATAGEVARILQLSFLDAKNLIQRLLKSRELEVVAIRFCEVTRRTQSVYGWPGSSA